MSGILSPSECIAIGIVLVCDIVILIMTFLRVLDNKRTLKERLRDMKR